METRERQYPFRLKANRFKRPPRPGDPEGKKGRVRYRDDPGGSGREIVRGRAALTRPAAMKPHRNIIQIPLRGGSGEVPTGAVQFQDDWPGLFVRGDHAIQLFAAIRTLRERLRRHPDLKVRNALYDLGELADIIARDVLVPQDYL